MTYKYLEIPIVVETSNLQNCNPRLRDEDGKWDVECLKLYFNDKYPDLIPKNNWTEITFWFEDKLYELRMDTDGGLFVAVKDQAYDNINKLSSQAEVLGKADKQIDKLKSDNEELGQIIIQLHQDISELESSLATKIEQKLLLDVVAAAQGHHKI